MKTILETYRLIFVVMFATILHSVLGCEPCEFSVFTVSKVDSCPEDENEWADRAAKKNCERYADQQTCSKPQKFKYHCAVDELEKKIVEVCAKEHLINDGICTEYNEKGKTIQGHSIINNTDVKPLCPKNYWSSEAYRCKGCNDFVRKKYISSNEKRLSSNEKDYPPMKKDCECGCSCLLLTVIVIFETAILVLVVVGVIVLYNFPEYISRIPGMPEFSNLPQHDNSDYRLG